MTDADIKLRPAVQYLRMSTEHQRYSLENQATAIAQYAAQHDYSIVGTYADVGKSGITLKGREGLRRLLADTESQQRIFGTILVLDISRWGRFQDPDQSASYEFLCRESGVQVEYCAEMFDNDGSLTASLVKHIKRIMAGEYSRELSAKTSIAQLRHAELGYYQGAGNQYGSRRMLVDEDGNPKGILEHGQRKYLATDKVLLVPGPPEEHRVIRRIFSLFVRRGLSQPVIVERLNREGVPSAKGAPWTVLRLHRILTNELSIGIYTYNKTTRKLKTAMRKNPEEIWIRSRIMPPIVSEELFQGAREKLARGRANLKGDKPMLRSLKKLLVQKGKLSKEIIDDCDFTPRARTYTHHFGSLKKAYDLIGYQPATDGTRLRSAAVSLPSNDQLIAGLKMLLQRHGYLSMTLIDGNPETSPAKRFIRRFGSMQAAYAQAGLTLKIGEIKWMALHKRLPQRMVWGDATSS